MERVLIGDYGTTVCSYGLRNNSIIRETRSPIVINTVIKISVLPVAHDYFDLLIKNRLPARASGGTTHVTITYERARATIASRGVTSHIV